MTKSRAPRGPSAAAAPKPRSPLVPPVVAFVLGIAAYANSLSNGFVWDDPIVLDRQLIAFDSLRSVVFTPRNIPQYAPDYYRPVVVATYLLDRAGGGGAPLAFHLSAVLFHAAASALVALLGLALFGRGRHAARAALWAGALFAVHPIHTESVAWSSGRSDVLATLFLVAAICCLRFMTGRWRAVAAGGLLLLALGSKETALAGIPLLLAVALLPTEREKVTRRLDLREMANRIGLHASASVGTATVVYLLLRRATLGEVVGSGGRAPVERSVTEILGAVGFYFGRLVVPVDLNAYVDAIPTHPALILTTLVALLGLGALSAWAVRTRNGSGIFLPAWILLTLAPSLAILWRIPEAPLAERYLYMPSVGFCLLVGWIANGCPGPSTMQAPWFGDKQAKAGGIVLALAVIAGLIATAQRNRVWHDNLALWTDTAAKSRVSGMAVRSLGTTLLQLGRRDEARAHFELALQRANGSTGLSVIHNNLGTIAMQEGNFAAAERHYRAAAQIDANAPDTLFNLALAILQNGGRNAAAARAALPYYERAEALSPYDPDIQAGIGQAAALVGDEARAQRCYRKALELGLQGASAESVRRKLAEGGSR